MNKNVRFFVWPILQGNRVSLRNDFLFVPHNVKCVSLISTPAGKRPSLLLLLLDLRTQKLLFLSMLINKSICLCMLDVAWEPIITTQLCFPRPKVWVSHSDRRDSWVSSCRTPAGKRPLLLFSIDTQRKATLG